MVGLDVVVAFTGAGWCFALCLLCYCLVGVLVCLVLTGGVSGWCGCGLLPRICLDLLSSDAVNSVVFYFCYCAVLFD